MSIITRYNIFKESADTKYNNIVDKYGSIGNYIENVFDECADNGLKELLSFTLGDYLKTDKKQASNRYNIEDVVLIEYWYDSHITPVKIIDKQGSKYLVSHNVDGSKIKKAPDEWIKKELIIDHYHSKEKTNIINPDIRISNAVSLLKPYDQALLLDKIEKVILDYNMKENIDNDKRMTVSNKEVTYIGQAGFNIFLKILNAMPVPIESLYNNVQKVPESTYLIFIQTDNLNINRLKTIMNRFKSFSEIHTILEQEVNIKAYYGLNREDKLNLEYGYIVNNEIITLGSYPLNKANFLGISDKNDKYVKYMLSYIEGLSIDDIKLFSSILTKISNFSFGFYKTKNRPGLEGGLLCFSYTGYGIWKDGMITSKSLDMFKSSLKDFIKKNNLSDKILFQVVPRDFTLHVKFKIK